MYYLVETAYVGINPDEHLNEHRIEIRTQPPQVLEGHPMGDGEDCIGAPGEPESCGVVSGYGIRGHGAYETLEAARAQIPTIPEVASEGYREADLAEEPDGELVLGKDREGEPINVLVDCYYVGRLPQLTAEETGKLDFEAAARDHISAGSSEEDLEDFAEAAWEEAAQALEAYPDSGVILNIARNVRAEKRAQIKEDLEEKRQDGLRQALKEGLVDFQAGSEVGPADGLSARAKYCGAGQFEVAIRYGTFYNDMLNIVSEEAEVRRLTEELTKEQAADEIADVLEDAQAIDRIYSLTAEAIRTTDGTQDHGPNAGFNGEFVEAYRYGNDEGYGGDVVLLLATDGPGNTVTEEAWVSEKEFKEAHEGRKDAQITYAFLGLIGEKQPD